MVGDGVLDHHIAARDGRGDGIRARLQAVGNNAEFGRMQFVHAVDRDGGRAHAGDLRAAGVEELGQADDFRLRRAVLDHGAAPRAAGGDHQMLRAARAGKFQIDVRALEAA